MSDIYGTSIGIVEQLGLADAEYPEDLDVKLASLEFVWEKLIPGFHSWFIRHRVPIFKNNLVLSARTKLNVPR